MFFALLCAGVAAGCGGSSSGPALSIPTPTPNPTLSFPPPPTNVPTQNAYWPSPGPSATNYYQFSGFIVQTMVRPPITVSPIPSPNPTNSATFVTSIAQTATSAVGASFNGIGNLMDFSIIETDTGLYGQFFTDPIVSNTYYQYTGGPSGTTYVSIAGTTSTQDYGTPFAVNFETVNGTGNGLLDVVPEPSQTGQAVPIVPANNASQTITETDPDGQVTKRSVNPDGSYTETAQYPDGTSGQAIVSSNGTGNYSFPLFGVQPNSLVTVASAASGFIPVTVNYAPGTGGPPTVNYSVPDWYPQNPPTLYSTTYFNYGPKNLPNPFPSPLPYPTAGACNLGYDVYGKIILHIQQKPYSNQLVQTVTKVDPVFGEVDTTTTTTWVTQGIGATCWEINDVVNQYYDYSGQSAYIPFFSGTPVQVTTTDVTMGLNQATIQNYSYRFGNSWRRGASQFRQSGRQSEYARPPNRTMGQSQAGQSQTDASETGLFLAVKANFEHQLERKRLQRHAAFWRQLKALGQRKGSIQR